MNEERKCVECGRKLRHGRKLDLCSYCQGRNKWKEKYEELKEEFERHKKICSAMLLGYEKKLKKYEPHLHRWDEEPE